MLWYFSLVGSLWASAWFSVDSRAKLEFENDAVASQFDGQLAKSIPIPPIEKNGLTYETVIQRFHFTSNTALNLLLNDRFCAGQTYSVKDNGWYLAYDFPSLPTICGVSTTSLSIIYSPQFMSASYFLAAGNHNLTIVIKGSQAANHVSTMAITLVPVGPIVGSGSAPVLKMSLIKKETIQVNPDFDINLIV